MAGTHEENLELFGDDDMYDVLDHIESIADDQRAWPKTLTEFIDVGLSVLKRRHGLNDELALKYAREIIVALAHHMGGRQVYFPRDERLMNAIRDNYIYRSFKGDNHQELADANGLTRAQIYNIIARQTQLHRRRIQPGLFD